MKIAWNVLAEGVAQDAKGVFSLIGLNQNLLFIDKLPGQTKRAMIVHLEGRPGEVGESLSNATFTFTVVAPSGSVLNAQTGQIQGAEFPFPDLPASADIPFETVIPIAELGEYQLGFRIVYSDGQTEQASASVFALSSTENPQFKELQAATPHVS